MREWLRVSKSSGNDNHYAPQRDYFSAAMEILSADMAKDFSQLFRNYTRKALTCLYDSFSG